VKLKCLDLYETTPAMSLYARIRLLVVAKYLYKVPSTENKEKESLWLTKSVHHHSSLAPRPLFQLTVRILCLLLWTHARHITQRRKLYGKTNNTRNNFRSAKNMKTKNTCDDNIAKWTGLKGDLLLRSVEDRTSWKKFVLEATNLGIEDARLCHCLHNSVYQLFVAVL